MKCVVFAAQTYATIFSMQLRISFITLSLAFLLTSESTLAQSTSIERLDPAVDALIPHDARIEKLAEGFAWAEGPVWRKTGGYLLFSDAPRNTINRWQEGKGTSIYLRPAGYAGPTPAGRELGSNGLTFDANDKLVMADHGNRQIARVNDSIATKTTLADRYEGKRLNSPNDLVFHQNGDLYFTDPPYGLDALNDSKVKELPFSGVYRLKPNGELTLVTKELTFPNGIGISPDGKTLYVNISDSAHPYMMSYDIRPDGNIANGRIFFDSKPLIAKGRAGWLDGMKIDRNGNIFTSGPGGILIITPQGKHIGSILTGELTANLAFGDDGSTLYITANHTLLRIRTSTKGLGF
jgi:gluconolactonase